MTTASYSKQHNFKSWFYTGSLFHRLLMLLTSRRYFTMRVGGRSVGLTSRQEVAADCQVNNDPIDVYFLVSE